MQPSGLPYRSDLDWQASRNEITTLVAKSDASIKSPADRDQVSTAVEMSWLLESQPNGSNIWFVQDWGIASILRYIREDLDVQVAASYARPVETPVDSVFVVDQGIQQTSARPWPDERAAEPAAAREPVARPADVPMVAFAELWTGDQLGKPAKVTRPRGRAKRAPARQWAPKSYFGWFVLILVSISAIVVLLVWILTMAV